MPPSAEKPEKRIGGARPGAGRKLGGKNASTLSKEAAREVVRAVIMRDAEEMTAAQVKAAKGLSYLVTREKGTGKFVKVTEAMMRAWEGEDAEAQPIIEVWEEKPSTPAYTDLMNRAIDKPKDQPQEVDIRGVVEVIDRRLEDARKRVAAR